MIKLTQKEYENLIKEESKRKDYYKYSKTELKTMYKNYLINSKGVDEE